MVVCGHLAAAIVIITLCVCVCVCVAALSVYHVERDICGVAVRVSILSRFKGTQRVIDGRSTESSAATQPCMMSPFCPDASSQIDVFNVAAAMLQNAALGSFFFFSSSSYSIFFFPCIAVAYI